MLSLGARALLPAVFFPRPERPTMTWRARVPALRFGPTRSGKPFRYAGGPFRYANPKLKYAVRPGAHLPIDGGASGRGILPMSEGLTQTHGQDARATAGIPMLPSIGRCALRRGAAFSGLDGPNVRRQNLSDPIRLLSYADFALRHSITYPRARDHPRDVFRRSAVRHRRQPRRRPHRFGRTRRR